MNADTLRARRLRRCRRYCRRSPLPHSAACAGSSEFSRWRDLRPAARRALRGLAAGAQTPRPRVVAGDALVLLNKDTSGLAPLDQRVAAARALARHPRIEVTGLEAELAARYSYDTIRYLLAHCPGVHFVWIMGADNLRSFHRWQKWRGIAALVPITVIDRLGPSLYAMGSVASHALARRRIAERAAATLPARHPPAWVLLHGLKSPLSSTALRGLRGLGGGCGGCGGFWRGASRRNVVNYDQDIAACRFAHRLRPAKSAGGERIPVETVNPLYLSYGRGPGQGARDGGTEREGPLSIIEISRTGARRSPDIVSKVRPDAEETLRIVLARLDDMKAEDTTTIDVRNNSSIADYLVVTSGRSNRHVGSVGGSCARGPSRRRPSRRPGRRHAVLRLGAD